MKKNKFKGFYETLCETIGDEKDQMYWEIIKYCPSFFKLLCNVLIDKRTDWCARLAINSALSYFVVPSDVIPEDEYGAIGYVDDVFLCAYVLKEIKDQISDELLVDNWEEKEDIIEIVENVFSESKKVIKGKCQEILEFSGLMKTDSIDIKKEVLPDLIKKTKNNKK